MPAAVIQYAEASDDECPNAGGNGESRCYATKGYTPDDNRPSVSVDIVVGDISVTNGFLQNALWSVLSDDRFIEAGFPDHSSNSEKIVCDDNGMPKKSATIDFSDGHRLNMYSYALGNGTYWKIGAERHNSGTEKSCTTMSPAETHMRYFLVGSEVTRPDSPDYEHEWDDLEINYQDVDSGDFSNVWITLEGTDYEVEECGSGDERYRHIQTGKGDLSQC